MVLRYREWRRIKAFVFSDHGDNVAGTVIFGRGRRPLNCDAPEEISGRPKTGTLTADSFCDNIVRLEA